MISIASGNPFSPSTRAMKISFTPRHPAILQLGQHLQPELDSLLLCHPQSQDFIDDEIISMYARGMSTREIQGHLEQIYGIEVSPTLIYNVTDAGVELEGKKVS